MPRSIFTGRDDNRLGITRMVTARGGVAAVYPGGKGPEVLLLDLEGESPAGKSVTVVLSAVRSPNLQAEGYAPGILTGIIRFGNGSGKSELEFDIPCAETHDQLNGGATNGMSFTVPAGNFRLYARDDSLIIPKAGQGNPSNVGGSLVTGFVTHGRLTSAGTSILRKTDFFAWLPGLPAGQTSSRFIVPPFAATYIIMRHPRRELTVSLGTNHVTGDIVFDQYTIPDGENHHTRTIPPRATWIEVVNEDGADPVDIGQIIYNMDFEFPSVGCTFSITSPGGNYDLNNDNIWNPSAPPAAFTVVFSEDVDPLTIIMGTTITVEFLWGVPETTFTTNVVGNTLTLTPDDYTYEDMLNSQWVFHFTSAIKDINGCSLVSTFRTLIVTSDD